MEEESQQQAGNNSVENFEVESDTTIIRKKADVWTKILIGSSAVLIVGSFLPWVKATVVLLGSITRSGIDGGDGWFSVVGGILLIGLAWKSDLKKSFLIAITVLISLISIFVLYEITDVQSVVSEIDSDYGTVSIGLGLWMMLASCIASWIALIKLFLLSKNISD